MWGWFGLFWDLLDVCGGFPLKRILADKATVWSNGIALHQNFMQAYLRVCVGVCGGVFGCVWVCVGVCGGVWGCVGVCGGFSKTRTFSKHRVRTYKGLNSEFLLSTLAE